jgi:hypothetical protein
MSVRGQKPANTVTRPVRPITTDIDQFLAVKNTLVGGRRLCIMVTGIGYVATCVGNKRECDDDGATTSLPGVVVVRQTHLGHPIILASACPPPKSRYNNTAYPTDSANSSPCQNLMSYSKNWGPTALICD